MALDVTNVQGSKIYLVPQDATLTTATDIATAISTGAQINCLQAIGDITETKNVQEYTCISSDESAKSIGSSTRGNQNIETLFSAADAAGQAEMTDMWDNNTRRRLVVVFPDQITPSTGNPTYLHYEVFPSSRTWGMPKDGAIMFNYVLEMASSVSYIKAT